MQNLLASGRLYPPWSAQRCFDQLADLDQAEVLFRRRHTLERHGGAERRLQLRNRRFLVGAYELVNVAGDPANAAEVSSPATLTAGLITCSGSACAALETVARP